MKCFRLSLPIRQLHCQGRARNNATRQLLSRQLQSSAPNRAVQLPHPTTPGPPPDAPPPANSDTLDRVTRKLRQLEQLQRSRESSEKKKGLLQKRFWKDVSIKDVPGGVCIMLDSRPVRTPSKDVLTIPLNRGNLATGIALEWDGLLNAQQALKQHYIPLTSLAARALDIEQNDEDRGSMPVRHNIIKLLLRYFSTDTLLCWAPETTLHDGNPREAQSSTRTLRSLQMGTAQTIVSYLTSKVWPGVEIKPILDSESIMPVPQPEMTVEVIREWLSLLPAYELAGLERAVLATKSLLVGVRLLVEWSPHFADVRGKERPEDTFGISEAADTCSLEVKWQTEMWGEVEDTHDVEREDLLRQLGGVVVLVSAD